MVDAANLLAVAPAERERVALRRDALVVTYGELRERAEALAAELAAFAPDTLVGIRMGNVPAYLVAFLACLHARRPCVLLDALWSAAELEHAAGLLDVSILLQDDDASERGAAEACFGCGTLLLDAAGLVRARSGTPRAPRALALADVALVHWSSGSTGRPKPILVTHAALAQRLTSLTRRMVIAREDRTLCILPLSHCHGIECLAASTLLARAELVLMDPLAADAESVAQTIANLDISVFSALPRVYDQLLRLARDPGVLRTLRLAMCGSAALDPELARTFAERFGVRIGQGYGLTEIGVVCLNQHERAPTRFDSVGEVLPGIEWRVDAPDADGVGELWLRGAGCAPAFDDEEERATRAPDGWLRTQDLVRADADGFLYVVGRRSSFVNVGGAKADPAEIEGRIAGLPWVAECAVTGIADESGIERVVAFVVRHTGVQVPHPAEAVRLCVAESLSIFKVPAEVIELDNLPRTSLGKVRYAELAGLVPSAGQARASVSARSTPRDAVERAVAAIWCEVLGRAEVGTTDSFSALGGTSIQLVQLLDRIARHFGLELTIVDLFRHPTVAAQAEAFGRGAGGAAARDDGGGTARAHERARQQLAHRARRARSDDEAG